MVSVNTLSLILNFFNKFDLNHLILLLGTKAKNAYLYFKVSGLDPNGFIHLLKITLYKLEEAIKLTF